MLAALALWLLSSALWPPAALAQCALTCNDPDPDSPLQVAVNDNCESILVPDALLESGADCPGSKRLTVRNTQNQIVVDGFDLVSFDASTYIGGTLSVTVLDTTTGIFCVSYIMIVDNLPPAIACQDVDISCVGDTSVSVTGLPVANDNCDPDLDLAYVDTFIAGDCLNGNAAVLSREWTATDDSGNTNACVQTINLVRPDLSDIVFPPDVTLDCVDPDISVDANGRPVLDGVALQTGDICDLSVGFTNDTNFICGVIEYSVLRTWTIVDNCTDQTVSDVQFINIFDEEAPDITCPGDIVVNTQAGQCFTTVTLPPPTVADNCDGMPDFFVNTSYGATGLGPHPFVPAGQHTVQYTAVDECGNTSVCTINLTVVDNEAPTAVCEDFMTVSVPSGGVAIVYAQSFDEGSTDNCQDTVYHKVRRLTSGACQGANGDDSDIGGYQEWFDDETYFCCEEVGEDSILVVMHVYAVDPGPGPVDPVRELPGGDLYERFTECVVTVDVQDRLDPQIACPAGMTIGCNDDYTDLSIYGSPNVSDNCSFTLDSTAVVDVDDCGVGTIIRTWTATDPSDNAASCTQVINVINDSPFSDSLIIWPGNYTTDTCGASVDPEDLPDGFREPEILGGGCGIVAVNYNDQFFNVAQPACYKILRRWSVIDWCQYDPEDPNSEGRFERTQIIKVEDMDDPVVTCPDDVTVAVAANCQSATVNLPPVTAQDCSPDILITNDSPFADAGGADASGVYPIGETVVTYNISDRCGNTVSCSVTVTVEDMTPPAPVCIVGLSVNLAMMNSPMAVVDAIAFDGGSFDNCTAAPLLKRNLRFSDNGNPLTPPDATELVLTCDDLGTHLIEYWVTDEMGNSDFCVTYITVQDNGDLCPTITTGGTIAGVVETEMGETVENVEVQVSSSSPLTSMTSVDGAFEFPDVPFNEDYTLVPSRTDGLLNGVTTLDLVLISRHILGVAYLDSPYKIIAADVDRSGTVTTFDIIKIRKAILGIDNEFPNGNEAWRFVSADFVFPDPTNPFVSYFPEIYNINNFDDDQVAADFVAVKVGDVNLSSIPNSSFGLDDRVSYGSWEVTAENRELTTDETATVSFVGTRLPDITGFQFTLMYDPDRLELVELTPGNQLPGLTEANFGRPEGEAGYLTASWHHTGGGLPENAALFSLTVRAKAPGVLSQLMDIGSGRTPAEAYDADLLPLDVDLVFPETETGKLELYQNRPNPFEDQTTIGFYLPEAGPVQLTVYDMAGKTLHTQRATFDSGYHELMVRRSDLLQSGGGILYYTLESGRRRQTRKMVLLGNE